MNVTLLPWSANRDDYVYMLLLWENPSHGTRIYLYLVRDISDLHLIYNVLYVSIVQSLQDFFMFMTSL